MGQGEKGRGGGGGAGEGTAGGQGSPGPTQHQGLEEKKHVQRLTMPRATPGIRALE